MKIKISVTKTDIEDGEPADLLKCPVALATKRAIKPYRHVRVACVDQAWLNFSARFPQEGFTEQKSEMLKTPVRVRSFMDKFDGSDVSCFDARNKDDKRIIERAKKKAKKLKPFSFVIKLPKEWFEKAGK